MLTARKENNQAKSTPFPQRPPVGSIDKVVNSIDGLRDRVQGFTLEQVSAAEQELRAMSVGLDELQRRLGALSELKDRINRLQETIRQAKAETLEESRFATDAEPVPIHAITQVGNLLKVRQIIKVIKAAQDLSVMPASRDQEAHTPAIFEPFEIVSRSTENPISRDVPSKAQTLTEKPSNEEPAVHLGEFVETSTEAYDPAQLEKEPEEAQFSSNEMGDVTQADETVRSIPIEDLHFESINATEYPQLNRSFPVEEIAETSDQTQAELPQETDIDRRLLDDLIRNYGEFSMMPTTSAQAEVHQESKNERPTPKPRADSPVALAPASPPIFPLQRKDGELDRKLKKLIKDYGEYDLYSRQTPIKLKTGVIVSFLVLSLVLSGFYFFSSPKSPITPSVSSASQSHNDSAAPPKETTAVIETSNGEPVSASSLPNGDTGASHNPLNKIAIKKTK